MALLVAFLSQLEILLVEVTEPRSHAMPLAMPLTPNPLAGSKIYYAAGQMPQTLKLQKASNELQEDKEEYKKLILFSRSVTP